MANEDLLIKKALSDIGQQQQPVFHNVAIEVDENGQATKVLPTDVLIVSKLEELVNVVAWLSDSLARIANQLAPAPAVPEDIPVEGEENDPALD